MPTRAFFLLLPGHQGEGIRAALIQMKHWISWWRNVKTDTYFPLSDGYKKNKQATGNTEGHSHLSMPSFSDSQGFSLGDRRSEYIQWCSHLNGMKRPLPLMLWFRPLRSLYFKGVAVQFCWGTLCFCITLHDKEGKGHCFPTQQHRWENRSRGNKKSPRPLTRNCNSWNSTVLASYFVFFIESLYDS